MPRGGRRTGAGRPRTKPRLPMVRSRVQRRIAQSNIHKFTRNVYYGGAITGSNLVDTFGSLQFQLNALPNFAEFTALFDMYRIDKIRVYFMPRANSAEVGTNQGLVKFSSVIDYDDIAIPGSINDLMQYENLRMTNTSQNHVRTLVPKFAKTVYASAIASGYGPATGWIDCDSPNVQHFGVKWCLQQLPALGQSYDIRIKYYLSFKNVR